MNTNLQPREDLGTLLTANAAPRVSITLAAEPTTPQGALLYRNLLRDAERQAVEQGIDAETLAPLLKRAYQLAGNEAFWEQHGHGVAIYAAPEVQLAYHLPYPVVARATIGPDFLLTPLAPLLAPEQPYYLLALSLGAVRLLRCGRTTVSEVPLPRDVPASLDEALKTDEFERERRVLPGGTGTNGRQGAIYFSHGIGSDERTGEIRRYCHQIDRGLREVLLPSDAPLFLAGVEEITATYRQVADYPHIQATSISGNADHLGMMALYERAQPLIAALARQRGDEASARCRALAGTGRSSTDPVAIAEASRAGRVETLLLAALQGAAGPHSAITADEALANCAMIDTLLHGGTVVQIDSETLPDGAALAAILRY